MLDTPICEEELSTSSLEIQELIWGLKSFGQGGEYADPTTDSAFKHLLSPEIEENKEIIKSFLNTFVPDFARDPVIEVRADSTATPRLPRDDIKQTFMDMHVVSESGTHCIIEMQARRHIHFDERALYYASSTYSQQIAENEFRNPLWYKNLKPVIAIQILGYDSNKARGIHDNIPDTLIARVEDNPMKQNEFIKHYLLTDEHSGQVIKDIQLIQIELPRVKKSTFPPNKNFKLIDWWLSIFKHAPEYTQEAITKLEEHGIIMPPIIAQALYRLYFPKWSPREIREYKSDTLDREKYALEYATERSEGIAKGKADLLLVQLEAKFGVLPQNYVDKLRSAEADTLHQWAINILHAQSLAAVFI